MVLKGDSSTNVLYFLVMLCPSRSREKGEKRQKGREEKDGGINSMLHVFFTLVNMHASFPFLFLSNLFIYNAMR